jgi:hypothetical protein
MYQLRKKNLADSVAICGRGRELLRPPTHNLIPGQTFMFPAPKQNLAKYEFKDDHGAETDVTRWLIAQDGLTSTGDRTARPAN